MRVHLDFESRSKAEIWDTGAYKYSEDPSTDVLCICYAVDDNSVQLIKREDIPVINQELYNLAANPEMIFVAHNAFFEQCIWQNIMVKRYGYPEIPVHRWRCSAAKALAHGLPKSLAECAKALNLSELKDEEGKRVMLKLSKPRKPTKNDPSEWHENEDDFQVLYSYCIQDVATERAIDMALPDLPEIEQKVWETDQLMNLNGIRVDLPLVHKALAYAKAYSDKLNAMLQDITEGQVEGCTKRMALMKWLKENDYEMENLQAATVRHALQNDKNMPADVRKVLTIKTALSKSSVSKYQAFLDSTCTDGRLRDILVYHSASTGRWGGKIVQLQNLPRGNEKYTDAASECIKALPLEDFKCLYPDVMGTLSSCIRSVLIPDEGKDLFVADYSAIEARVIAWLADEEKTLNAFRNGDDVYCLEASKIFGRTITKKDKFERSIGKVAILALGYQGGIGAFGTMAQAYEIDLDPVYDLMSRTFSAQELESAQTMYQLYRAKVENPLSVKGGMVADIIKQRWRKNNSNVVKLWSEVESAALKACHNQGIGYEAGRCKFVWPVGSQFLYCYLPSGRALAYHHPKIQEDGNKEQLSYNTLLSQTKKYVRTTAYGGKLVENIVQAVARDLMAHVLVKIQQEQVFIPHLTVHDEIITSGDKSLDPVELEKRMCDLPSWADDLPIAAEGWKGIKYKKG